MLMFYLCLIMSQLIIDSECGVYRVCEDKGKFFLQIFSHESYFALEDFLLEYAKKHEDDNVSVLYECSELEKMIKNIFDNK